MTLRIFFPLLAALMLSINLVSTSALAQDAEVSTQETEETNSSPLFPNLLRALLSILLSETSDAPSDESEQTSNFLPNDPDEDTDMPISEESPTTNDEKNAESPQGTVSIVMSDTSPTQRSIPRNAGNVDVLIFHITAPADEDVQVQEIVVTRRGLGRSEDIERVKAFVGFQKFGNQARFSRNENTARLNLIYEPIQIPAGTTQTIRIAADFDAESSGGEHLFLISSAQDITITGSESGEQKPLEASFPLQSGTQKTASVSSAQLRAEIIPETGTSFRFGQKNARLARIELEETSSQKDVEIYAISINVSGSGDVTNLSLQFRGESLTPKATEQNDVFTLNFTNAEGNGFILDKGDRKTLDLRGEITGRGQVGFRIEDVQTRVTF